MADVVSVEVSANGAILHYDDGSTAYAPKSLGQMYQVSVKGNSPDPDPGPDPDLPDSLVITDCEGGTRTMRRKNLEYALQMRKLIEGPLRLSKRETVIAFMTSIVETYIIQMYANSTIPESLNYPHDAVGNDNDSLGFFQQRPAAGWGSVAQLMDLEYNVRAFIGGANGPNMGSPRGMLDVPGWRDMGYGTLAQTIQVSAHPERYDCWRDAAELVYKTVSVSSGESGYVWPYKLSEVTSEFRPPGRPTHDGMDFSGPNSSATGAPIPAAHAGTVQVFTNHPGFGNGVNVVAKDGTYTRYAHMYQTPSVTAGQKVKTGDILGGIGNTGNSFGNHLHFETRRADGTAVNPRDFMRERNAKEPS